MAMIEALACGVPCLLSPACNFPEIEDFGAGEIVPLKESKWSDACAAWMADEPRRRTASKAAFAVFRDRLTIDRVAGRLEEIMRKVVAGGTVRQSR
jgi:glycosyltransferase involved in cell wall biosynthesis